MTSGNLHDEPICMTDDEARSQLASIADAFLGNNRPIRCRFDDSVVRVISAGSAGDAVQMVRRARGFAPMPISLAKKGDQTSSQTKRVLFAAGPEQKNTFCLLRGDEAFVSQHIGDMENAETFDAWLSAKEHFESLFQAAPESLVADMHPEYLVEMGRRGPSPRSRRRRRAALEKIQHHHAHIVSAMTECGLDEATIGVAFDGTGYGYDGRILGRRGSARKSNRFREVRELRLPSHAGRRGGGENPLRMAYGALHEFDLLDHPAAAPAIEALGDAAQICDHMIGTI